MHDSLTHDLDEWLAKGGKQKPPAGYQPVRGSKPFAETPATPSERLKMRLALDLEGYLDDAQQVYGRTLSRAPESVKVRVKELKAKAVQLGMRTKKEQEKWSDLSAKYLDHVSPKYNPPRDFWQPEKDWIDGKRADRPTEAEIRANEGAAAPAPPTPAPTPEKVSDPEQDAITAQAKALYEEHNAGYGNMGKRRQGAFKSKLTRLSRKVNPTNTAALMYLDVVATRTGHDLKLDKSVKAIRDLCKAAPTGNAHALALRQDLKGAKAAPTGNAHALALRKELKSKPAAASGGGSTQRPPAGFTPIPHSTKGGYHKKQGAGYIYWYPGIGVTRGAHADDAGHPKDQKPQPGKQAKDKPPTDANAHALALRDELKGAKPKAEAKPEAPSAGLEKPDEKVITDPAELPPDFNKLSKKERAVKTADYKVVSGEMEARFGAAKGYDAKDLGGSIDAHLDQLGKDGWIVPNNVATAKKMMHDMVAHAEAAGVKGKTLAALMEENVRKLAHQEIEAAGRTLGDHGVRHLSVNAKQSDAIFEQLKKGGVDVTPMDHFMAYQVWLDHDMGYTIPAIARGGFAVKDNYHPQASTVMGFQQRDKYEKLFGKDGFQTYINAVANHSGQEVDWKGDFFGSAVRLADNTHLFADKMPEVLFDSKIAVESMVKIRMALDLVPPTEEYEEVNKKTGEKEKKLRRSAEEKAKVKSMIGGVKQTLMAQIEKRTDLPAETKHALLKAAREVGEMTPKFLVGRLAGRNPQFNFDGSDMKVTIEQSDVRNTIGKVFGDDDADKQFTKLLEDYGVTPKAALDKKPPPPGAHIGKEDAGIEFIWTPPTNQQHAERRHADEMAAVKGDFDKIKGLADGTERDKALGAFFGTDVAKSLAYLLAQAPLEDWLSKSDQKATISKSERCDDGDELRKKEALVGGEGDGKKPSDFDPKDLETGRKVEAEHTKDPKVATEIAQDHLTEDKDYYRKLADMEAKKSQRPIRARIGIGDAYAEIGADEEISKALEAGDGLHIGVQPTNMRPPISKGTIYQGEMIQPNQGDDRTNHCRAEIEAEIIEDDPAGFGGNGGLAEWWRDVWKPPQSPNVVKSDPGETEVIDDSDPIVRSAFTKRDY